MSQAVPDSLGKARKRIGVWFFPAAVLCIYAIIYLIFPAKTLAALVACKKVGTSLVVPLVFVIAALFLLNLFVSSSFVARLLGKRAGGRAILLSLLAGIVSAGPIYAWYPLLKDLKEQGAGNGPMAVFLYNRAVKPFLLPVMIGYFGWHYVLVLTFMMILGSLLLGYGMQTLERTQ